MRPVDEGRQLLGQSRSASQPAADQHPEAQLAARIAHQLQPQILRRQGDAIGARPVDADLELARQLAHERMGLTPLVEDRVPGARVFQLVGGQSSQRIDDDAANAVARGQKARQPDLGQLGEDLRHGGDLGAAELDGLARGEMHLAQAIVAGDARQPAQLLAGEPTLGRGHAQHGGLAQSVESVQQAQGAKRLLAQVAVQIGLGLAAEAGDVLQQAERLIGVVQVHGILAIRLGDEECAPC